MGGGGGGGQEKQRHFLHMKQQSAFCALNSAGCSLCQLVLVACPGFLVNVS